MPTTVISTDRQCCCGGGWVNWLPCIHIFHFHISVLINMFDKSSLVDPHVEEACCKYWSKMIKPNDLTSHQPRELWQGYNSGSFVHIKYTRKCHSLQKTSTCMFPCRACVSGSISAWDNICSDGWKYIYIKCVTRDTSAYVNLWQVEEPILWQIATNKTTCWKCWTVFIGK